MIDQSITNLTPTTVKSLGGIKLQTLAEMDPYTNILVYGDPGVGKTRLAASADQVPEMRNVLLLDVDGGALSAKNVFPRVTRIAVDRWQQIEDVYKDLASGMDHGFRTVVLDTGTEAQKYDQAAVMARVVAAAREKGEYRDAEVPGIREWGITTEHFRRMVRLYRDLPLNFIMTCHVKEDRNDQTGEVKLSPDLPGKLTRQVSGFFDIVMYMYVRNVLDPNDPTGKNKLEKRLLATTKTQRIIAKDRTDRLPPILGTEPSELTMKYIHDKINGKTVNEEKTSD